MATTIKMLSNLHFRPPLLLRHQMLKSHSFSFRRLYSITPSASGNSPTNTSPPPAPVQEVSDSKALPTSAEGARDAPLEENPEEGERQRRLQAPNRAAVWSRSQQPREKAMVGPRFEQTIMQHQKEWMLVEITGVNLKTLLIYGTEQPQPLAAIELIHKQPVRWSKDRVTSCDGGGGPLGHPRIFINLDKPQVHGCTYCGLPFAYEHHKQHLQSLPPTPYPLEPLGDNAEAVEPQKVTDEPFAQR